jgi:hypothetical protein
MNSNNLLFKYLRNHSIYKCFCTDDESMDLINENNKLKKISCIDNYLFDSDIYIEIVPGSLNSMNAIFMNIWYYNNFWFRCYAINNHIDLGPIKKPVGYSDFFHKYPTLSTKINYNLYSIYECNENEIIEVLENLQILNPKYQDKQFQIIIEKCIQILICIKNILYSDLRFLLIKILLKLMHHGEDFLYHNKFLKIEKENIISFQFD